MKNIRGIVSKPSEALQAMIDGMLEQTKRKDFRIRMSTFGHYDIDTKICYGCGATCAVMKLAGKNLRSSIGGEGERAKSLGFNRRELSDFEIAIDHARRGCLDLLFDFFGFDATESYEYNYRFELEDYNWEKQIPEVEKLISELKAHNY